jgi:hypothetical protein
MRPFPSSVLKILLEKSKMLSTQAGVGDLFINSDFNKILLLVAKFSMLD